MAAVTITWGAFEYTIDMTGFAGSLCMLAVQRKSGCKMVEIVKIICSQTGQRQHQKTQGLQQTSQLPRLVVKEIWICIWYSGQNKPL